MPELARGGGVSVVDRLLSSMVRPLAPYDFGPVDNGASSTIEFHAPQASQRPAHLPWAAPQAEQVNCTVDFAMGLPASGRQRLQARAASAHAFDGAFRATMDELLNVRV